MFVTVEDENVSHINAEAGKFYDLFDNNEGDDTLFWLEYSAYMSQPVNETETLQALVDFVGA